MAVSRGFKFALLLFTLTTVCEGWPGFKSLIPNGDNVPDPCGGIWGGVGHLKRGGGGARNSFGLDFAKFHGIWSSLCNTDSDGDGRSNGVELGDPDCVWRSGDIPSGNAIGHPGICEPVGSPNCTKEKFTCSDTTN